MNHRSSGHTIMIASLALLTFAAPAFAKLKGDSLSKDAKISLAAARNTALKARPGTITDQELETEKGGSGLRYSFDIKSQGKSYEVGVDAKTGVILENGSEGAD